MSARRAPLPAPRRTLFLGALAALGVLAFGSSTTLSGWASANLGNSTVSARTGSMAITHTYAAGTCSSGARVASVTCAPTLTTQAVPPASTTDSINNSGDGAVNQTVTGASCGVVQLANTTVASDPLLPRSGTTFSPAGGPAAVAGSGAVTLDSTAYATGVTSKTLGGTPAGLISLTEYDYGYGIWFRSTSASGRLFGFASSPSNTPASGSTTFDRTLSLSAGKLVFGAGGASTATTAATYNDGSWHHAYVSLTSSSIKVLVSVTITTNVTIYVDGVSRATSTGGNALATPTGYWSAGGSFAGSLSNFATYDGTSSPTSPPAAPYSGATERWPLNDSGTTTATATLPTELLAPCGKVNVTLTFTNPAVSIGALSLAAFADGSIRSAGSLAAGQTQGLTIATSTGTGYTTALRGLHLYVPITFRYTYGASSWVQLLTWSGDPAEVFWA